MEKLQAFKFQLRPTRWQGHKMRQFAGCCRKVWNMGLALKKSAYGESGKNIGYAAICKHLAEWKKTDEYSYLKDVHSQILQQALKDLDRAYQNFFAKRADFPRFKKKGRHDAFRYPQGFKLDEGNQRVFLPKIGWMRYRAHRQIEGAPKNVTVSLECGKWYVSIQTACDVPEPVHTTDSCVGIDRGIAVFAACSDGMMIEPVNSFRKHESKLAWLQRQLSRKIKFSANWQRIKDKISRLHHKIANIRKDFLHKLSTMICKNHAVVVLEDLNVKNMSKSAKGTLQEPGKNVSAKSGLNKSILD